MADCSEFGDQIKGSFKKTWGSFNNSDNLVSDPFLKCPNPEQFFEKHVVGDDDLSDHIQTITLQLKRCTASNSEGRTCDEDKIENIIRKLNLKVFMVNTNF